MKLLPKILLLLVYGTATASGQTALVTINGGSTVDLCASCERPQIRMAVTPAPKFRPTEAPTVSEVSVGTLRDTSLRDAFKATWEKGKDNYPIALVIDVVDPAKVKKAGTYTVVLNLLPTVQPDAPPLTIQVQHPAAQLQVPSKLVVQRVKWFADDQQSLYVSETTGKSAITDIQVLPGLQPSLLANTPVSGILNVTNLDKAEPGKTRKVSYELNGCFPLGTVTGSMQITAPQLTQAVPLNFEVHSRLPLLMIFVYALMGAIISWFLKAVLQTRIELNEARSKARDLLQLVNTDLDKHIDKDFRQAIAGPKDKLEGSCAGNSATAIETDRQALEQKWHDALKELTTRRDAVQKSFDELRSITDNTWQVPKPVADIIADAKKGLDNAAPALTADDLDHAATALKTLLSDLGQNIKLRALEWQQEMANYFDALQKPRGGISTGLKAGFKTAADKQQSALVAIKDDTPSSTVSDIVRVLSILGISLVRLRDPLSQLTTELNSEVAQTLKKLSTAPDQTSLEELEKKTLDFVKTLLEVSVDPSPSLITLPSQLSSLDQAWRDALLKQLGSKDPKSVEASLNIQDYPGATTTTVALLKGSSILSSVPTAPSPWPSRVSTDFVAGPVASYRTSVQTPALPQFADRTQITSAKQLLWDKSLQSLVLFVLVGLGAMMLYQNTFVGTFDDFAKVFFWAFGLDITFDAVRQATRPKTS